MGKLQIKKFQKCFICGKKMREKGMIGIEIEYNYGTYGGVSFRHVCSENCLEILKENNPEGEITIV